MGTTELVLEKKAAFVAVAACNASGITIVTMPPTAENCNDIVAVYGPVKVV
jgi:hypothetical protein